MRAAFLSPENIFPAISLSRVEVFAHAPDLAPEAMRAQITHPLQAALRSLSHVREMRSYTTQGAVEVELDFDPASDPATDKANVDTALAELQPRPAALTSLQTVIEHPNMEPIVSYGLIPAAGLSQAELLHDVRSRLTAAFTGTHGLERVIATGGAELELRVAVKPDALARAGVTARDVAQAIAAANATTSAGTIDTGEERSVLAVGSALDSSQIAGVAVATPHGAVRVGALATVARADGPAVEQASVDGEHAVIVNAYGEPNGDAAGVAREFDARMTSLVAALPAGTRSIRYWDQTRLVASALRALQIEMLVGALLALVVVFAFLRSRALTLVAAITVPVSVAITILAVTSAGTTLNLMSIGGLAIAIGLIVDESIVVLEAVARRREQHPDDAPIASVRAALAVVARPLVASTLAIAVVFAPLALVSGIPGAFFRTLALTLCCALAVSIALSLGFAPSLASLRAVRTRAGSGRVAAAYARVLAWSLSHRAAVFVAGAVVFASGAAIWLRLPSDFLPELDERQFEIKYQFTPGANLATTDRLSTQLERAILADPAVEHEGRLTGVDTNGYLPTPPHAGTIRVVLRACCGSYGDIADRLRARMYNAAPGAIVELHQLLEDQLNDLTGAPEPIQIAVTGPNDRRLDAIAVHIANEIDDVPGVEDPFTAVSSAGAVVGVGPAPGMSQSALAAALSDRLRGIVATHVDDGGDLPVRVVIPQAPVTSIGDVTIPTASGMKPLRQIAPPQDPLRAHDIFERNGTVTALVTADLEGAPLSAAIAGIRKAIAPIPVPPGYTIAIGGAYDEQQTAFAEFATVLVLGVVLVLVVLVAAFDSFRTPAVVLATIPLAPLGASLALLATGTTVNVASFMGALLLVGIVARNGILIVDAANRLRAEGATSAEAIAGAGAERLRPILMTACATVASLLPIAIGFGAGAELERPLAIAVIGGLAFATLGSLVVIPALYLAVTQSPEMRESTRARSAASDA